MVEHIHPAAVVALWLADFVLLAFLWPVAGEVTDIGAVLLMWAVPTALLAGLTMRWRRSRTARRSL